MQQRHAQLGGKDPDPARVAADVEICWTLILEAFRRGVQGVHEGLHRAEGIDHAMIDQSLAFALTTGLAPQKKG